jgi:predicted transcriptional regulator
MRQYTPSVIRRAKYTELREEGLDKWQAGAELGISVSTIRNYERWYEVTMEKARKPKQVVTQLQKQKDQLSLMPMKG